MGQGEGWGKGRGARGREEGFFQAVEAEARAVTRVLCIASELLCPDHKLVHI